MIGGIIKKKTHFKSDELFASYCIFPFSDNQYGNHFLRNCEQVVFPQFHKETKTAKQQYGLGFAYRLC